MKEEIKENRKKAIKKLGNLGDASVIQTFLPLLNAPNNYVFYNEIISLVNNLAGEDKHREEIRRLAYKAHMNL